MHVGTSVVFQNPGGNAGDPDLDADAYDAEYRLADRAEGLGFDSLWSVEHHLNGYAMCPDPLKFLMYFAGRTKTIQLGTMVVVMPWHHPIRVCEDASVLDNVSGGRLILGLGRGLAKREFDAFGVDMNQSRDLLVEGIEVVKMGLTEGFVEYDGKAIQQNRALVRPKPRYSFEDRIYGSAQSPETYHLFGKLGIGLLFIPGQKSWDDIAIDLDVYRTAYRDAQGREPPPPIFAGWTFVDEDPDRAREFGYKYIRGYVDTALDHYDIGGAHMRSMKGYEAYAKQVEAQKAAGVTDDQARDYFVSNHFYGTPDQVFDQISTVGEKLGAGGFIAIFKYANMGADEAIRNQGLFASKVLPRLKALDVGVAPPRRQDAAA